MELRLEILLTEKMKKRMKAKKEKKIIISPTLGDLRLSKFVIDIFLMSEKMELVDRLLSPKFIMFETDNFLLSLWDLSGSETFTTWFPVELLFELRFTDNGEVGVDLSTGNDSEDLLMAFSSCSSAIVAGWCDCKRFSLSLFSSETDFGDVGESAWIEIGGGGGEGVEALICTVDG
jgi:hypothetical protein